MPPTHFTAVEPSRLQSHCRRLSNEPLTELQPVAGDDTIQWIGTQWIHSYVLTMSIKLTTSCWLATTPSVILSKICIAPSIHLSYHVCVTAWQAPSGAWQLHNGQDVMMAGGKQLLLSLGCEYGSWSQSISWWVCNKFHTDSLLQCRLHTSTIQRTLIMFVGWVRKYLQLFLQQTCAKTTLVTLPLEKAASLSSTDAISVWPNGDLQTSSMKYNPKIEYL